jgi:hypothetical protein
MRFLQLLCLGGALASALNAGTIIFSNVGETNDGADSVEFSGPLYDSFTSGAAGQITGLQLILSGDNTSSGAFQVVLYANNSDAPAATPIAVLSSVGDSALSGTPDLFNITLIASPLLEADTVYWIGLSGETTATWSFDADESGIGVAGEFFSNGTGVSSDSLGPYQMQVTESPESPEPASIFSIAAGAGFLALLRGRAA